jgi:hypothetical protein
MFCPKCGTESSSSPRAFVIRGNRGTGRMQCAIRSSQVSLSTQPRNGGGYVYYDSLQ